MLAPLDEAESLLAPRLRRAEERGQGLAEYGIAVVLIAIFLILIITVVGQQVNNGFSNVQNGLNGQ